MINLCDSPALEQASCSWRASGKWASVTVTCQAPVVATFLYGVILSQDNGRLLIL